MRVIELWRVVMTRARPTAGDERGGVVWGGCTVRAQSVGGAVMVTGVQMCAVALSSEMVFFVFFFQAEDGIRDLIVTGVQTCALPISERHALGQNCLRCRGLASSWHDVLPRFRRSFESHDIAFAARMLNHHDRIRACRNRGDRKSVV